MSDKLDDVWDQGLPKSPDAVQKIFDEIFQDIRNKSQALAADPGILQAEPLFGEIQKQLEAAESNRTKARSETGDTAERVRRDKLADQLTKFAGDLRLWQTIILSLTSKEAAANARARFADAATWGVHFSTVRM